MLKKNRLKPWLTRRWCIPPRASAEFVWRMEDILGAYTRPYGPSRPLVCLDEVSKQLIGETRCPRPIQPGRPARYGYEYARNGTANLFLITEPLRGWRHVTVTERRTRVDWAHVIRDLLDLHYPGAEKIVLVLDNLNTHTPGSLYEAFPPAEARRLVDRLEIRHTPKHGSWLNIAEIEPSTMAGQCQDRRIPDPETLEREVAAWKAEWSALGGPVSGRRSGIPILRLVSIARSSVALLLKPRSGPLSAVVGRPPPPPPLAVAAPTSSIGPEPAPGPS